MAKKKNKMNWQRNLPLSEDKSFINTAHWFEPEDFVYEREHPLYYKELCCNYLNMLRIEYITLRNNGQPKSSYKPEVADKINARKEPRLAKKLLKATKFMEYNGMKLKDDFDRMNLNPKPKFTYGESEYGI